MHTLPCERIPQVQDSSCPLIEEALPFSVILSALGKLHRRAESEKKKPHNRKLLSETRTERMRMRSICQPEGVNVVSSLYFLYLKK